MFYTYYNCLSWINYTIKTTKTIKNANKVCQLYLHHYPKSDTTTLLHPLSNPQSTHQNQISCPTLSLSLLRKKSPPPSYAFYRKNISLFSESRCTWSHCSIHIIYIGEPRDTSVQHALKKLPAAAGCYISHLLLAYNVLCWSFVRHEWRCEFDRPGPIRN